MILRLLIFCIVLGCIASVRAGDFTPYPVSNHWAYALDTNDWMSQIYSGYVERIWAANISDISVNDFVETFTVTEGYSNSIVTNGGVVYTNRTIVTTEVDRTNMFTSFVYTGTVDAVTLVTTNYAFMGYVDALVDFPLETIDALLVSILRSEDVFVWPTSDTNYDTYFSTADAAGAYPEEFPLLYISTICSNENVGYVRDIETNTWGYITNDYGWLTLWKPLDGYTLIGEAVFTGVWDRLDVGADNPILGTYVGIKDTNLFPAAVFSTTNFSSVSVVISGDYQDAVNDVEFPNVARTQTFTVATSACDWAWKVIDEITISDTSFTTGDNFAVYYTNLVTHGIHSLISNGPSFERGDIQYLSDTIANEAMVLQKEMAAVRIDDDVNQDSETAWSYTSGVTNYYYGTATSNTWDNAKAAVSNVFAPTAISNSLPKVGTIGVYNGVSSYTATAWAQENTITITDMNGRGNTNKWRSDIYLKGEEIGAVLYSLTNGVYNSFGDTVSNGYYQLSLQIAASTNDDVTTSGNIGQTNISTWCSEPTASVPTQSTGFFIQGDIRALGIYEYQWK